MFAHRIVSLTGPQDVQRTEMPEPATDGGVVVDVAAAGVSFADLLQTTGAYQMKLGNIGVLGVASREFFEHHPETVAELWARLIELREAGVLDDPPVQLYPFADARGALRAITGRKATGTVVLSRQARRPWRP
jgi:NADPH:quinone reductase-like Zn-dependent oxidoreductase